jgi:hypothetical protein
VFSLARSPSLSHSLSLSRPPPPISHRSCLD